MENKIITALIEATVFSGIIYCAVMLFKKFAKQKISPFLQYALWSIFILRLILPVSLDVGFRFIQIDAAPLYNAQTKTPPAEKSRRENRTPENAAANAETDISANGQNNAGGAYITVNGRSAENAFNRSLTWQQCTLSIWFAGIVISFIKIALSDSALNKRLRSARVGTPDYVKRIFTKCRKQLGVKRRIPVITVAGIDTPALTVSVFPKVVIPKETALTADGREIYFALIHELTHYKRKDYLCCLLLQALQVVYWFNPFVRLAVKEIRPDMESACDASVVKHLKPPAVADYAKALIKLSCDARLNCAPGIALGSTYKTVEKRIRGIYMVKKSKPRIKAAAALMAAVICLLCFTTACVPAQKAGAPEKTPGAVQSFNLDNTAQNSQAAPASSAPTADISGNVSQKPSAEASAKNIALPPTVEESAIWREDNRLKYVFAVYNPNKSYAVAAPTVNIRAYDKNGEVIMDEFSTGQYILPESYWYCAEPSSEEIAEEPAEAEFIVIATQDVAYVAPEEIQNKAQNVKIIIDKADKTGIYGKGVYPEGEEARPVNVIALYRDNNGELKGAYRMTLNSVLEDGVTAPIKIIYDGDEKYITDNVEFYVQPWG